MILGLFYTQDSWGSIGNEVSFRVRVAPPPSPTPTLDRCASKNVTQEAGLGYRTKGKPGELRGKRED